MRPAELVARAWKLHNIPAKRRGVKFYLGFKRVGDGKWKDVPIKNQDNLKRAIENVLKEYPNKEYDQYWSPTPFKEIGGKTDKNIMGTSLLFSDLDGSRPERIDKTIRPNMAWETSPGNFQCMWILKEFRSSTKAKGLNKALNDYCGGDPNGGGNITKYLRVPGTINHKPEYANGHTVWGEVKWCETHKSSRYKYKELVDKVGEAEVVDFEGGSDLPVVKYGDVMRIWREKIPGRVRSILKRKRVNDRSAEANKVYELLAHIGMKAPEVYAIMKECVWLQGKWRDNELWDDIERVFHKFVRERQKKSRPKKIKNRAKGKGARALPPERMVRACDIETADINWAMYPLFAYGECTMVEGHEGRGKSSVLGALAAYWSKGRTPQGYDKRDTTKGAVLIYQSEESVNKVLAKRLIKLRANMENIFILDIKRDDQEQMNLTEEGIESIQDDIDLIEAQYNTKVRTIIVDPLFSFMGEGVDIHRANEVRPVMNRLQQLLARNDCVGIVVRHFRKGTTGKDAKEGGMGSIEISNPLRIRLSIGVDPNDFQVGVLACVKNSFAETGKDSLRFKIIPDKDRSQPAIAKLLSPADITAGQAIDAIEEREEKYAEEKKEDRTAVDDAKKWLLTTLDNKKPMKRSEVYSMGETNGLIKKDLNKAFRQLKEEKLAIKSKGAPPMWKLTRRASS